MLERLLIPPVCGIRTFKQEEGGLFYYVHPDFAAWGLDCSSPPSPETAIWVNQVVQGGTYRQALRSLSENENLDALCLTQDQAIQTLEEYSDKLPRASNFFFFFTKRGERVNRNMSNLFTARVVYTALGLYIYPDKFLYANEWRTKNAACVVTPKRRRPKR